MSIAAISPAETIDPINIDIAVTVTERTPTLAAALGGKYSMAVAEDKQLIKIPFDTIATLTWTISGHDATFLNPPITFAVPAPMVMAGKPGARSFSIHWSNREEDYRAFPYTLHACVRGNNDDIPDEVIVYDPTVENQPPSP